MKNSPQISRKITSPFSRLNLSAQDMLPPVAPRCGLFGSFQWIGSERARAVIPAERLMRASERPGERRRY